MTSKELNAFARELENRRAGETWTFCPEPIKDSGKALPYIGWFWRDVDFDEPFPIGLLHFDGTEFETGNKYVGFMENNKWGYSERLVTDEERGQIRDLLEIFATETTETNCQRLCDYMQTLKVASDEELEESYQERLWSDRKNEKWNDVHNMTDPEDQEAARERAKAFAKDILSPALVKKGQQSVEEHEETYTEAFIDGLIYERRRWESKEVK